MKCDRSAFILFLASISTICHVDANSPGGTNPASYGRGYSDVRDYEQQRNSWQNQLEAEQNKQSYQNYEINQSTLSKNPDSSDSASLPPLPPGWNEYVDPASGQPYYYNSNDGTTTWDRPDPLITENTIQKFQEELYTSDTGVGTEGQTTKSDNEELISDFVKESEAQPSNSQTLPVDIQKDTLAMEDSPDYSSEQIYISKTDTEWSNDGRQFLQSGPGHDDENLSKQKQPSQYVENPTEDQKYQLETMWQHQQRESPHHQQQEQPPIQQQQAQLQRQQPPLQQPQQQQPQQNQQPQQQQQHQQRLTQQTQSQFPSQNQNWENPPPHSVENKWDSQPVIHSASSQPLGERIEEEKVQEVPLTKDDFQNYQQGQMPVDPRGLRQTSQFQQVYPADSSQNSDPRNYFGVPGSQADRTGSANEKVTDSVISHNSYQQGKATGDRPPWGMPIPQQQGIASQESIPYASTNEKVTDSVLSNNSYQQGKATVDRPPCRMPIPHQQGIGSQESIPNVREHSTVQLPSANKMKPPDADQNKPPTATENLQIPPAANKQVTDAILKREEEHLRKFESMPLSQNSPPRYMNDQRPPTMTRQASYNQYPPRQQLPQQQYQSSQGSSFQPPPNAAQGQYSNANVQRGPYSGQYGSAYPRSIAAGYGQSGPGYQQTGYGQHGLMGAQQPSAEKSLVTVNQEQPSLVSETLSRTWQGILGFRDRTKAVVEQATDTVISSAKEAQQTIAATSQSVAASTTSLWDVAKNRLGSVFESNEGDYSLASLYGAPPPSQQQQHQQQPQSPQQQQQQQQQQQHAQQGYSQGRGYPPQYGQADYTTQGAYGRQGYQAQPAYPLQQRGPPQQSQQQNQQQQLNQQQTPQQMQQQMQQQTPQQMQQQTPQQMQQQQYPTGRFPPGYSPPQPRADAAYPFPQQNSLPYGPGQQQPPLQGQWQGGPLYQQQQQPNDPTRTGSYPQHSRTQQNPQLSTQQRNPDSNQEVEKKKEAWFDHPSLTDGF